MTTADARSRDHADEESHAVRPGDAACARRRVLHQGRRHPDVVVAEHRERQQRRARRRSPRGPKGFCSSDAEEPARERRGDAERRICRGHAEHVERREAEGAATSAAGLAAEEADRQGNDGVDAGRQVEREAPSEERAGARRRGRASRVDRRILRAPRGRCPAWSRRASESGTAPPGKRPGRGRPPRCAGAPAVANLTLAGARHCLSLQAWKSIVPESAGAAPVPQRTGTSIGNSSGVDGERRLGERELLHLALPGRPGSPKRHARRRRERDLGRDEVVLGGLVAVDVPSFGEPGADRQRALAGLGRGRDRGLDRQQRRRVGRRGESERPPPGRRRAASASAPHGALAGSRRAMKDRTLLDVLRVGVVLGELLVEREGLGRLVLRQRDLGPEELGALLLVGVLRGCDQAIDRLARGGRIARLELGRGEALERRVADARTGIRAPRPPASDTGWRAFDVVVARTARVRSRGPRRPESSSTCCASSFFANWR